MELLPNGITEMMMVQIEQVLDSDSLAGGYAEIGAPRFHWQLHIVFFPQSGTRSVGSALLRTRPGSKHII